MGYKINDIEGIGPAYMARLHRAGISTTEDLLRLCADPAGRKSVSEKSGVGETQLLNWANMADLMRISGVGPQYAELLEAAGVDTVKELKHRNAELLAAKIEEINARKKLARTSPAATAVADWIEQAASLEPKLRH